MRYTLYRFPSYLGSPKDFRWKWQAALYAMRLGSFYVYELKDNKTGEYKAFWK